jgi:hypothetical protein
MSITPAIREFLIRLEDLLDAHGYSGYRKVTDVDTAAFVKLDGVELEIDDKTVLVRYRPEEIRFTKREEALQFMQMIADGRVQLEVQRSVLWATMRSYRDGQTIPFRRTRMPWMTLRPHTERRAVTL